MTMHVRNNMIRCWSFLFFTIYVILMCSYVLSVIMLNIFDIYLVKFKIVPSFLMTGQDRTIYCLHSMWLSSLLFFNPLSSLLQTIIPSVILVSHLLHRKKCPFCYTWLSSLLHHCLLCYIFVLSVTPLKMSCKSFFFNNVIQWICKTSYNIMLEAF